MKHCTLLVAALILTFTNIYAQKQVETDSKKKSTTNGTEKADAPAALNDKIEFKNGTNAIITINDEGSAGSISIPSGSAPSDPSGKLYNYNGSLYWSSSALANNISHYFSAYFTQNLTLSSNTETQLSVFTEFFDSGNSVHNDGLFLPSTGIFTVPQTGIYHFDFSVTWKVQTTLPQSETTESPVSIIIKHSYNDHGTPVEKFYRLNHFVHLSNAYDNDIFGENNFNESVMYSANITASTNSTFSFFVWYENSKTLEIVGGNSAATTTVSAFKVN